jgi:hypothetical protein
LSGDLKQIFLAFAARHDRKLPIGMQQLEDLNRYYTQKTKAFAVAVAHTQKEFWNREDQLDKKYQDHDIDSIERVNRNFQQELDINVRDAYRQLGYDTTPIPPETNIYQVRLTTTGWFNIDRYVMEATESRTTLDVTDPRTGKKAVIQYQQARFLPEEWNTYEHLYVYLLPDRLSSYIRLTGANGTYVEKLNELLSYDLVCIAYKGDQAFFYSQPKVQPGDHSFSLRPIDSTTLNSELNKWGNRDQAEALIQDNSFHLFEHHDRPRQQRNEHIRDLQHKVEKAFFGKCSLMYESIMGNL